MMPRPGASSHVAEVADQRELGKLANSPASHGVPRFGGQGEEFCDGNLGFTVEGAAPKGHGLPALTLKKQRLPKA